METELKSELDAMASEFKAGIAGLTTKYDTFAERQENFKKQIDLLRAEALKPREGGGGGFEQKSVGQLFVESAALKDFASRPTRGRISVQFPAEAIERKTTITSATVGSSTPGILTPERVPQYVTPPAPRLRVRDLIPFGRTTSNAIEFVKRNSFTSAASPVTEASEKQESELTFTITHSHVVTIAHWIPASRQVLDDFEQLRAIIDSELLRGLRDEEDYQLLRGDGLGAHLAGLIPAATAYAGTYDAASDTRIDKLNHAIAELNASNYQPDAVILNPVDYRVIQVTKTNAGGANTGDYILGGPGAGLPTSVWGLPVSLTNAMQVGKFLVGQFQGGCQGFDRLEASCELSTEHSDFWIRNLCAIRCESRVALVIYQADAFRYGSF